MQEDFNLTVSDISNVTLGEIYYVYESDILNKINYGNREYIVYLMDQIKQLKTKITKQAENIGFYKSKIVNWICVSEQTKVNNNKICSLTGE